MVMRIMGAFEGVGLSGLVLGLTLGTSACTNLRFPRSVAEDAALVPADGKIEVTLDDRGGVRVVEFQVDQEVVPLAALASVDQLAPGPTTGCEREYVGGKLYYEVIKEVGGRIHEVQVASDGTWSRSEIEIDISDAPSDLEVAVDRVVPGGRRTVVEKVQDRTGTLLEYHVKKTVNGKRFKIIVEPNGTVREVLREIDAEIEVPIRLR